MLALRLALLILAGSLGAPAVCALGIEPLGITLSPAQPTQTLRVRNDSDVPRRVQLETLDWHGWDNARRQMAQTPSATLIANPPVFLLPARASQLVRIGLPEAPPGTVQRAFRLLVRELPALAPTDTPAGHVTLLVNFNLPVFYTPSVSAPARLQWQAETAAGQRRLYAHNLGERAIRLTQVHANGTPLAPQDGHNGYLLAGQRLAWLLPASAGQTLSLTVQDNQGQWFNADVAPP